MKLFATLVLLSIALSACTDNDLGERLRTLERVDVRHDSSIQSVVAQLVSIRPAVILAHDSACDSLYNSLVTKYTACVPLSTIDWRSFIDHVGTATALDSATIIHAIHALRVWGNFDATRSLSVRQFHQSSVNNPDVLGSIAAEYVRLECYRAARPYAIAADSMYEQRGLIKGRLWMLSTKYIISACLRDSLSARTYLREFRLIHDNLREKHAMSEADTATAVNLFGAMTRLHRSHDISRAFGDVSQVYARMYEKSIVSSGMVIHNSWKHSRSDVEMIPKPVIRSFRAYSTVPVWTDSLTFSKEGELYYDSRFGRYALHGRDWELSSNDIDELHYWTYSNPARVLCDTLYFSNDGVRFVAPVGRDTLLAFTPTSALVITAKSRTLVPIDKSLASIMTKLNHTSSIVSVGNRLLVLRHGDTVILLERETLKAVDRVVVDERYRALDVDAAKHSQLSAYGVVKIGHTHLMFGRPNTYDIYSLAVDTVNSRLMRLPLEIRTNSSDMTSGSGERVYHVSRLSSLIGLTLSTKLTSPSVLTIHNPILASYSEVFNEARPIQIPASEGFIACRMYDHIDILDTVNLLSLPQLAARFPIAYSGTTQVGVFTQGGVLYGYYNDGHAVVRFPLSQHFSRLQPSLYFGNKRHFHRQRALASGTIVPVQEETSVNVSVHSNVITQSSPLLYNLGGSASQRWTSDYTAGFWHTELIPPQGTSSVAFTAPLLTDPLTIVVKPTSKLYMMLKTIVPFVALALSLAVGIFLIRYRKKQRLLAIQHAKSQQLELIREDMHDMIGSRLVRIASLARQTKPEDADAALARIHDMTLVTVRSLRNLLSLMSETTMTDAEFFGALREYVVESCTDAALTPTVIVNTIDDQRTTLDGGNRHELMMIVSEMLANTLRHAQARSVSFTIHSEAEGTTLNWQDDGVGIAPSSQRGNGLNNIQRRAARLHASVNLISHPGGGTQYTITIPISVS